ncbi:hypothetical protein BOTBODRAFT_37341 [Botryobasidium botryosum FD-172 SS1]|uniref:Uncharacterized protein n=1 Tax=Botryobasidium botryosum (strain FD-172 SS1) TaxID=930990 RepID=A0A067M035_BOTB1|nr:hypothetical protein BOTBODRAFT_37341 [Botryobasidium botryosum FD-172 SS1]
MLLSSFSDPSFCSTYSRSHTHVFSLLEKYYTLAQGSSMTYLLRVAFICQLQATSISSLHCYLRSPFSMYL